MNDPPNCTTHAPNKVNWVRFPSHKTRKKLYQHLCVNCDPPKRGDNDKPTYPLNRRKAVKNTQCECNERYKSVTIIHNVTLVRQSKEKTASLCQCTTLSRFDRHTTSLKTRRPYITHLPLGIYAGESQVANKHFIALCLLPGRPFVKCQSPNSAT